MGSMRQLLNFIVVVGFVSHMSPQPAWSVMYQCRDANGETVFADSTAQLQHCRTTDPGTTTHLSSPVGAAAAPRPVPVAPEPPNVPDQSDAVVEPAPDPSAEDDALPGSQSRPPCIAGINPLSPFRGPGCSPDENTLTDQPDLPPEPQNEGRLP